MSYRSDTTDGTSRRVIDQAIGVLVGLRGCSPEQAFTEIIEVMDQTGLGIGTISAELVQLAGDLESTTHAHELDVWTDLIGLHRTLVTWPARHRTGRLGQAPAIGHGPGDLVRHAGTEQHLR
jgi:hypothetical protein